MSLLINKNKIARMWRPTRVVIIGCGGIGSNLWDLIAHQTYYSAKLALAGNNISYVNSFLLVDADAVEPKNLFRQSFFSRHIGMGKAQALADKYERQLGEVNVSVNFKREWLNEKSDFLRDYDLVLLGVDNDASRKILNDMISPNRDGKFNYMIAVNGGNTKALSTVQVMIVTAGDLVTSSFEHMHPEITNPSDKHPSHQACTTATGMAQDPQLFRANQHAADLMFNVFQNAVESKNIDYCMLWADLQKMEFAKDPIPQEEVIVE